MRFVRAYCDYHRLDTPRYWRSRSGYEVDFVFENLAVEVEAKGTVGARDMKGLRALREEGLLADYLLVAMEPQARVVDGIRIVPWADFLDERWSGHHGNG